MRVERRAVSGQPRTWNTRPQNIKQHLRSFSAWAPPHVSPCSSIATGRNAQRVAYLYDSCDTTTLLERGKFSSIGKEKRTANEKNARRRIATAWERFWQKLAVVICTLGVLSRAAWRLYTISMTDLDNARQNYHVIAHDDWWRHGADHTLQ